MRKPSLKVGIYRHYKGELYEVLGVALQHKTLEPMVVYQGLLTPKDFGAPSLWVRPLHHFLEMVEVDGKKQARFQFVSETYQTSTAHH